MVLVVLLVFASFSLVSSRCTVCRACGLGYCCSFVCSFVAPGLLVVGCVVVLFMASPSLSRSFPLSRSSLSVLVFRAACFSLFLASLLRSPCAVCDRAVSFGPFRRFVSLLSAVRLFVHCIHTDSLLQYMLLVCGLWPFGQPRTHTLQRSGAFAPSLYYTLGYPSIHPFIDKQTEHNQVPLKISTALGAWG